MDKAAMARAADPGSACGATLAALAALPEDLSLDLRLERSFQIEDAAWPQLRRLGRDYLTSPRLGRQEELSLWQANYDYWRRLVAAYEDCAERYRRGGGESAAASSWLGVLYSRLLHAYVFCHKWARFRYGPVPGHLWSGAGRAYLAAVASDVAEQELTVYPGADIPTSPRREYLNALMLHASSMDNLLPLEIEIAQQLISHFLPLVTFSEEPRHGNVYWVDAATSAAPRRLARMPEATPGLRFFSAGKTLIAVAELRQRIAASGEVPADIRGGGQFGGQYTARSILRLLDHLAGYWSPSPPSRSHPRQRVKLRLTVVHGLAAIQRQLAGDAVAGEAWIAENVSRDGIGAVVALEASDWVRIGVLVGMQPEGGDNWLVGVVRRLARESEAVGVVGISTLGKAARPLLARNAAGATLSAILIDVPYPGETVQLVMERGAYDASAALSVDHDGARLELWPEALAETGTDFALGRYRVEAPTPVSSAPTWDERP